MLLDDFSLWVIVQASNLYFITKPCFVTYYNVLLLFLNISTMLIPNPMRAK